MTSKILILDIETSPNLAHVWGIWQQNIGLSQLLESSTTLCFAAKWLGEDKITFKSLHTNSRRHMLRSMHKMLDEADAVIHYNGSKFDIPTLNKEFLLEGMPPPSPVKQIDLLQVAKKQFRFVSNKLDYVAKALGLAGKVKHEGHELWIKCLNNDPEAWAKMKEYNMEDVALTEKVYERFKPWIKHHLNLSIFSTEDIVCPNCGKNHYQKRGFAYTSVSKFQRYQCTDCGNWFRGNKNLNTKSTKVTNIN